MQGQQGSFFAKKSCNNNGNNGQMQQCQMNDMMNTRGQGQAYKQFQGTDFNVS